VSDLSKRVQAAITAHRLLDRGGRLLVAVSGGVDSMVLLDVLESLASKHRWRLAVAHFNHQLRGRSSDADQRLVQRTAKRLGLKCVTGAADVRAHAEGRGVSIEMAARELRHRFLATIARRLRISTIALAHHADDQVELFFLRLLRGSGTEALAGMKWRNPSPQDPRIRIIRPLLGETKAALLEYASARKLPFREDATNAQLDIQRNRIRNELLPLLETRYQPALRRVILRQMEILGSEGACVSEAAQTWLAARARPHFRTLGPGFQRRVLQLQATSLAVPLSFELIEQLRLNPGCPVSIRPSLQVWCDADGHLVVRKSEKAAFGAGNFQVKFKGGRGALTIDNVKVRWESSRCGNGTVHALKWVANVEVFDADKVGETAVLRHWRKGDRFQPIGMAHDVKLQDLFTNAKVPRAKRHELIVAETGKGTIFWVEGLRMGERFKLDNGTRRQLKWRWNRL
jgi:tRNA(Ile)-lysidine synthase